MSDDHDPWLDRIDRAALTLPVRQALGRPTAEVVEWTSRPLLGGAGDLGSGNEGLFRFAGTARDGGQTVPWSLVLKFAWTSAHGGDPSGGLREQQAYQSGVLEHLPGISAPRYYGLVEAPEMPVLLWMEEITNAYADWPLERYQWAARQLGRFNGTYLAADALPDWPWLSRKWLRTIFLPAMAHGLPLLDKVNENVMAQRAFPPDVVERSRRLWDERGLLLDGLERLPQTVCHLDAFNRNMLVRSGASGEDELVLLDWAFSGIAGIGEELASFITGTLAFRHFTLEQLHALEAAAIDGYLQGLREAGWRGRESAVRFGYLASTALRYGMIGVGVALPGLMDEKNYPWFERSFGLTMEEFVSDALMSQYYLLDCADEARTLLNKLP